MRMDVPGSGILLGLSLYTPSPDCSFVSFKINRQWPKRPKIVCSPSYVDSRSRANKTRGLDFEHMIKARAHKGGVRIGKTPKKLASICCP
jgi:hypothetical protein